MHQAAEIIVAVKGIILFNRKLLLVRRSPTDRSSPGMWECPGGGLEFGETPEAALSREIREETGLDITPEHIMYVASALPHPTRQIILLHYLCHAPSADVKLSYEHDDFRWVTYSQMQTLADPRILKSWQTHDIAGRIDLLP